MLLNQGPFCVECVEWTEYMSRMNSTVAHIRKSASKTHLIIIMIYKMV